MPQMTKQSQRQIATPSPTPGDVLNTLLAVKDAVNSVLLNEHTRFADLSNTLSEVENQVREAFETTLKSLKTEIEKRKRKVVPGIKKMQELLKSLSKSETKCKASEKGYKNAVSKKAKRRIKDTQKYLKDFVTTDTDLNLSSFLMDQMASLCQRLMAVPSNVGSFKRQMEVCETPRVDIDNSESDSESSKSRSRNATPVVDHIYNEIDNLHSKNARHRTSKASNDNKEGRQTRKGKPKIRYDSGGSHRLNSVMLFSSDSDSDDRERMPQRPMLSDDSGHPPSRDQDYEQLIHVRPQDVFKNYKTDSSDTVEQHNASRSPANNADYEIPIQAKHDVLFAPIATHPERRSSLPATASKSNTSLSATAKRLLPATPKTRPVPDGGSFPMIKVPTPTLADTTEAFECIDCVDSASAHNDIGPDNSSLATNTVELLAAAQTLLNDIQASNDKQDVDSGIGKKIEKAPSNVSTLPKDKIEHSTIIEPDYVDIEEIKFRETVRTARREILDRLKNKYPHQDKYQAHHEEVHGIPHDVGSLSTKYSDSMSYMSSKSRKEADEKENNVCVPADVLESSRDAGSLPLNHETESKERLRVHQELNDTHGVYRSRLIHTYESKSPIGSHNRTMSERNNTDDGNDSLVSAAIQKFEGAVNTNECKTKSKNVAKRPKPVIGKYAQTTKHRSTSEPRTSSRGPDLADSRSGMSNTNGHSSRRSYHNTALLPRKNSIDSISNVFDETSISLSKSSTESDLLKLLEHESSSFIRKQWSKRRSSSMTPKIPAAEVKAVGKGPEYQTCTTFTLPTHSSRCYISSIIELQNGNLILLDERHRYLHLYDQHFKHKDSYRLLDMPNSCVKLNEYTMAVSFPYKKTIGTYSVTMGAILSDQEISVPCSAWIVDIAYGRKILYVLCKDGDVHLLFNDGSESNKLCLGMSGKLFVPHNGNRLYVMGENKINKFDSEGVLLSSKSEVDTNSMIVIENKIYVADRRNHKIAPLVNSGDMNYLTWDKLMYPLAMCCTNNGKYLFVSQFEESMDIALTRTIQVLRLKHT